MMMRSCVQLPGRESLPNNRPRRMFSPLRRLPQQRTRHTKFVSVSIPSTIRNRLYIIIGEKELARLTIDNTKEEDIVCR